MAARPSKAVQPQTFDYACLGDAGIVAREAAGRIAMRSDAETRAKSAWTRHGLDILKVRRVAKHGHFEAWVKHETPFTVRLGQMMSDAVAMLVEHLKSENFSCLPALDKAVTYTLAAPSTPPEIRAEFLPRLLAGERGLRKLVLAALKPEACELIQDEAETEPVAVPVVPSRDVVNAVDAMPEAAFRTVLSTLTKGRTEELIRALEWRAAKPVVPDADIIAEKAKTAARTMPLLEGILPGKTVIAGDDFDLTLAEQAVADEIASVEAEIRAAQEHS